MTDTLLSGDNEDLTPDIDSNKDYLAELTKEGGKFDRTRYKSDLELQQAIARGKFESDQYIEILKKRQDELRDDYLKMREENTTRARLEEFMDQMKQQKLTSNENTPVKEDNQPSFDPKQIESLVSNKIQEHEATRRQQENFNLVKGKLEQRYGANYKAAVTQQLNELGITEAELNDMARKQPRLLLKSLGLDKEQSQDPFNAPPKSNQRSDSFAPSGAKKRTWSYYQDMKRKDPRAWLDRKTAIQMQQDAIDLGDAFKDGDYYVKGLHE